MDAPNVRRFILITGATDGIGKETAKQLVNHPDNFVIIHGRNTDRCRETISEITKAGGCPERLDYVVADFASLKSIPRLISELRERFPQLNVIVCNAGVLLPVRQTSEDGVELTFQVSNSLQLIRPYNFFSLR